MCMSKSAPASVSSEHCLVWAHIKLANFFLCENFCTHNYMYKSGQAK